MRIMSMQKGFLKNFLFIFIIILTTASEFGILLKPCGRVVQSVRTLACHARGRGFKSLLGRQ